MKKKAKKPAGTPRKGGRPKAKEGKSRARLLTLKVSAADLEQIARDAQAAGLRVSDYQRRCLGLPMTGYDAG